MSSSYTGRVGAIVNAVARQFNDTNQAYVTDADCLAWINEALLDLARFGYFTKLGTFNVTAATETYVLTTALSDFVTLNQLVLVSNNRILIPAGSWDDYQEKRSGELTGDPWVYFVLGTTLYVYPVPSSSATGGFQAMYAYAPTALTGSSTSSGDTPPTPTAWDQYYVDYCLYRAFQRREADTYSKNRQKAPEYETRAMRWRNKLLAGQNQKTRFVPYRP
jgi:hypothetical protein